MNSVKKNVFKINNIIIPYNYKFSENNKTYYIISFASNKKFERLARYYILYSDNILNNILSLLNDLERTYYNIVDYSNNIYVIYVMPKNYESDFNKLINNYNGLD